MPKNTPIWKPADDNASWIFPTRPEDSVNQLIDVFQTFDTELRSAELLISADTDFAVWLNGNLIGYGQYSDYPDQKTHERFALDSALHQGENKLAITVFYNGRNSSVYRRGEAGVVFAIQGDRTITSSGVGTLCRPSPSYHSGPIASVSGQLFYTFGYDARGEDGFNTADYFPGPEWAPITDAEATLPENRSELPPRPISRLEEQGLTACKLHSTGVFRRDPKLPETTFESTAKEQTPAGLVMADGKLISTAWLMQHDYLSPRTSFQMFDVPHGTDIAAREDGLTVKPDVCADGEGVYLIVDMGIQEVGHLDLDITVPEGTTLDMGYGEHLDDLRVRTWVGSRSFAARYISRGGRQQFIHHFQRWAGRYLAIHVHSPEVTFHHLCLNRRAYPVTVKASLDTGDQLHDRIVEVAQRTLVCCMHEHYEDTPWREQALYANDSRTQALCGYYAFGETEFPASSFSLLGRGERGDGFLYLTAPAKQGLTIPSFTFCWMLAVRDQYLYSGDDSLARQFLPQIRSMLNAFLNEREDGLLPLRQGNGMWHFYDWSGMSGYSDGLHEEGLKADAPLNCFLILALEATQQMMAWLNEPADPALADAIEELRTTVADRFWDADRGLFQTHDYAKSVTQLTQALAVLANVGTTEQRESALTQMAENSELIVPGLSQTLYTFSALMTRKDLFGSHVLADIEETWGKMLKAGATTFWETIGGAGDFHNAGSLCHAWSAVPVYVYFRDLVGVRPTAPGYRRFVVDPVKGVLDTCTGVVPTPHGDVTVKWTTEDGKTVYTIVAPDACEFRLLDRDGTLSG